VGVERIAGIGAGQLSENSAWPDSIQMDAGWSLIAIFISYVISKLRAEIIGRISGAIGRRM